MLEDLLNDVRFAVRWLARSPGFTVVAAFSLAVGIGFNATLFGIVDVVLFKPLPLRAPGELVNLYTSGSDGDPYATSSYPDYLDLRDQNGVFQDVVGHTLMIAPLNLTDRSRLVMGELVTGNYFGALGVQPALGRSILPEDDRPEAERVAMISHRHWLREFGGDASVLGKTLRVRGQSYAIVGVAPASFTGLVPLLAAELWLPVSQVEEVEPAGIIDTVPSPSGTTRLERRGYRWLFVKGRLKPGMTIEQARANLDVVMRQLTTAHPETNKDRRVTLEPTGSVRLIHPAADKVLLAIGVGLMTLVGLVLLIACANVASMLLARASARRREIGIRLALGAGRGRLIRQFLTESVVLALLGAALGAVMAWASIRALAFLRLPLPIPLNLEIPLDGRVWVFLAIVAGSAGVITGLAPALRATSANLVPDLRGEAFASEAAGRRWTLRDLLVGGQMAVTVVLLVAAGLLARSLMSAGRTNLGFRTGGIAIVSADPEMTRYDEDRTRQFFERAVERIGRLPGVEAVARATRLPLSLNFNESQFDVDGHPSPQDRGFTILNAAVSPTYFRTLDIALLEGRGFTDADSAKAPRVAVISEPMARRFWPRESAVGKQLRLHDRPATSIEIVGVAADHRVRTLGEEPQSHIYLPLEQRWNNAQIVVARTSGDASTLVRAMERELLTLEPNLVLIDHQTMGEQVSAMLLPVRAGALVASAGGVVALGLAALGLYGAIAFSVARRTRELGVRMALGADRRGVVAMVLRQGLTLAAAGAAVGVVVTALAVRALGGLMYGVGVSDPAAWTGALLSLFIIATLANLVPAYRASRVNPAVALRAE